jgi:hypothetical protein
MDKKHFLSISELNAKYDRADLASTPGDRDFRYKILSPLFENLYENKVVYHERFTCIVKLEDIFISPEMFCAIAIPHLMIKKAISIGHTFTMPAKWDFGSVWEVMTLSKNTISAYSGWSIWCDPILVQK